MIIKDDETGEILLEINQKSLEWNAKFLGGTEFTDPWITACLIQERFPIERLKTKLENEKIKHWWREQIPVAALIWILTGRELFWKDRNWDSNFAEEWWKDRVVDSLFDSENLLDAVIALRHFKNVTILENIANYMNELNKKTRINDEKSTIICVDK